MFTALLCLVALGVVVASGYVTARKLDELTDRSAESSAAARQD